MLTIPAAMPFQALQIELSGPVATLWMNRPDLHNASIHVSVYGTEKEQKDTMSALHTATRFVRRELGSRLQLRDVPEIIFRQDTSIERGAKVFAIINKLHKEEEQNVPEPKKAMKVKAVKKNA